MKEHIINLDRPRRLKFGFRASRLIREKFGSKDVDALKDMNIDEFPYIAYAGLVWEDETLTAEKVEQLLDEKIGSEYTVVKIIGILSSAIVDHMGVDFRKVKGKGGVSVKKKKKSGPRERIPSGKPVKRPTK